jgi:HEXXH motif-containing protein
MDTNLSALVPMFRWTAAAPCLCRDWGKAYQARVESQFRDFCKGSPIRLALLAAYDRLEPARRQAFLLAPRVAHELVPRDSAASRAAITLCEELLEAYGPAPEWLAFEGFEAECLGGLPPRESGIVQPVPLPAPTRDGVAARIREAMVTLQAGNPSAAACTRELIVRLVVLEDHGNSGLFTSNSFGDYPGLVLLTNPAAADTYQLIDGLVHEAVHTALFHYEAIHGALIDPAACSGIRLVSPWSGRSLAPNQYIHACFVWFSLAFLWGNWRSSDALGFERVIALRDRARQGLDARPWRDILHRVGEHLSEQVVAGLQLLSN